MKFFIWLAAAFPVFAQFTPSCPEGSLEPSCVAILQPSSIEQQSNWNDAAHPRAQQKAQGTDQALYTVGWFLRESVYYSTLASFPKGSEAAERFQANYNQNRIFKPGDVR